MRDRHESNDLGDYDVLDDADSLDSTGPPGEDPLDRGVASPEHWSAAMRPDAGNESLDEQLAEEEPDPAAEEDPDLDDAADAGEAWPRAGRLVEDDDDLTADDAGVAGGAASAEEAAVHLTDDTDG